MEACSIMRSGSAESKVCRGSEILKKYTIIRARANVGNVLTDTAESRGPILYLDRWLQRAISMRTAI